MRVILSEALCHSEAVLFVCHPEAVHFVCHPEERSDEGSRGQAGGSFAYGSG